MKKVSEKIVGTRYAIIVSMMIASGLLLFSFNLNVVKGIPSGVTEGDYLFGRTIGIVENENGTPLWIISGIWKTNLSNQTKVGDNSTVFDASLNMIKTDGTSKHTHALTNFILAETTNQNNATVFNGTGTVSMPDSSITDVPISIKVLNNDLGIIYIDPNKVDNHFGTNPIYGIPLEEK